MWFNELWGPCWTVHPHDCVPKETPVLRINQDQFDSTHESMLTLNTWNFMGPPGTPSTFPKSIIGAPKYQRAFRVNQLGPHVQKGYIRHQ